jgi:glycosyltransferase involved in cell wall biosynthesis
LVCSENALPGKRDRKSILMSYPSISIILCTLNRRDLLERCLNSLMELNYPNVEILVIDNGSTNIFMPEINYRYRTRFYRQPIQGLSYGRNLGIHFAEGDLVAFIDDDAFPHIDWIRNAISHFENPDIGCVTGRIVPVDASGNPLLEQKRTFPNSEERVFFNVRNFNPIKASAGTGSNFLIRRNILEKYHFSRLLGPGVPVGGAEEQLLFFQIIKAGWAIVFEPESIVFHEYPQEESSSKKRNLRNSASRIAFLILLFLKGEQNRLELLIHAVKRMSGSPTPHHGGRGNFHWRSLYLGPWALFKSALLARKNKPHALNKSYLIREFSGETDFQRTTSTK